MDMSNSKSTKYSKAWRPMPIIRDRPQNRLTYAQAVFIEWFKSIHPKLRVDVYFYPDENGVDKPRVMLNFSQKHDFGYDELYEIFKEDYEKINQQTNGGYKKRGINTKRHRTRTRTRTSCKNRSSSRKFMNTQ
jgi:hypothetical protein